MTITIFEGTDYYFSPQDFGFPVGATYQDYFNYYVEFSQTQNDEGGAVSFIVDGLEWEYQYYPLIWFPEISYWGLRRLTSYEPAGAYSLEYRVVQRKLNPITIPPDYAMACPPYPSIAEINLGSFNPISLSVNLTNITHTFFNDLYVFLQNPANDVVCLLANDWTNEAVADQSPVFMDGGIDIETLPDPSGGGSIDNIVLRPRYTSEIYSQFVTSLTEVLGIRLNNFRNNLNDLLVAGSSNGTWKLYVYDYFSADGGSIEDWSLDFKDAANNTLTYTTQKNLTEVVGPLSTLPYTVVIANILPVHELLTPLASLQVIIGGSLQVSVFIEDPDSGNDTGMTTTVTVSSGTLYNSFSEWQYVTTTGNGTNQITLTGYLYDVSYITQYYLYYYSSLPTTPVVTFTISTTDIQSGTRTDSYPITILYPDPPVGQPFSVFVFGTSPVSIHRKNFAFNTPTPVGYQYGLESITVTKLPEAGVLKLNSVNIQLGQVITAQELENNGLVFYQLTEPQFDETYTFEYLIRNDLSPGYGGNNTATAPTVVSIFTHAAVVITAITPDPVTIKEGEEVLVNYSTFGYSTSEEYLSFFESIEILSVPSVGVLKSGSRELSVGDIVNTDSLGISYVAPENAINYSSNSFNLRLNTAYGKKFKKISMIPASNDIQIGYKGTDKITATPFPSELCLNSNASSINNITVTLRSFEYRGARDLRAQLVAPSGEGCLLFYENIYDSYHVFDDFKTLAFNDYAISSLPDIQQPLYNQTTPSGAYKPSRGLAPSDYHIAPLPANPVLSTTLSGLEVAPFTGPWSLYIAGPLEQYSYDYWGWPGYIASWDIDLYINLNSSDYADTTISVNVEPEDDAPRIICANIIQCKKEIETAITGLSVLDPDGYSPFVSVSMTCSNGKIRIADFSQLSVTGNNSGSITVSGNYLNIKSRLELANNLFYTGNLNFTGIDVIDIVVNSEVPANPTLTAIRTTNATVIVRSGVIINTPLLSPTYISHPEAIDTAIAIYWNDPRIDGSYWLDGVLTSASPKLVPDFEGQLIAYLTYENSRYRVSLLCGHNPGTTLQWYDVRTNGTALDTSIDLRTGGTWDPYWQTNCNPPWICD